MARKVGSLYPGYYLKGNYKRLTIWQPDCPMNAPFVLGPLQPCLGREMRAEMCGLVKVMD